MLLPQPRAEFSVALCSPSAALLEKPWLWPCSSAMPTASLCLCSPPLTRLAALLANSFPEAGHREIPVLMYAALVLLGITLVVNIFGAIILERATTAEAR